jgi:putative transposase
MKLRNNDCFSRDGKRHRLLKLDVARGIGYVIEVDGANKLPVPMRMEHLGDHEPLPLPSDRPSFLKLSEKSQNRLDKNWAIVQKVLAAEGDVYDPTDFARICSAVAAEAGVCARTVSNITGRFWRRGMSKAAVIADYRNSGRRRGESEITAGRGRKTKGKHSPYQITQADIDIMEDALDKHYYSDERKSLAEVHKDMLIRSYSAEDGNGKRFINPPGSYPTYRQFRYYFNTRTPIERALSRAGARKFINDHRPTLSTAISQVLGVAHRYEIDATIKDVKIVSELDPTIVIGKATVYLVVDTLTRYKAGSYVTLEHPCWESFVEALVSLCDDKEQRCARLGIPYDPNNYLLDGLLPAEIVADHGEGASKYATALADDINVAINNTRALVPRDKPCVESGFGALTKRFRGDTPGYEPPENLGKRRKRTYIQEAALTMRELETLVERAKYADNNNPRDYPFSKEQCARGTQGVPSELVREALASGKCLGRRADPLYVRAVLLPRAQGTLSRDGLDFNGLRYGSDSNALTQLIYRLGGKSMRVEVTYDRRSVDVVYIHMSDRLEDILPVRLTEVSASFSGLSFAEAKSLIDHRRATAPNEEWTKAQVALEYAEATQPVIQAAVKRRDALGKQSDQSRTKNAVAGRHANRRKHRSERGKQDLSEQDKPHAYTTPTTQQSTPSVAHQTLKPTAAQLAREDWK